MACYISSNDNRFYAALESNFGLAALVTEQNRIPAVKLAVRHETQLPDRRDKTGGRTFVGLPSGFRKRTTFELETFLTGWSGPNPEPSYGPLFQAALGSTPIAFAGRTLQGITGGTHVAFTAAHGLVADQAVECGGEIRFVSAIVDAQTVILNSPFAKTPIAGAQFGPTVTYLPATELPSVSIHDYWDPRETVQRILAGCGVDQLRIGVNGDFHQFRFQGIARDLVDSATHTTGQAGLSTFPVEPAIGAWNYAIVPGNLGQAWFGNGTTQFYSVLDAEVILDNDLESRSREFGLEGAQCLVAGRRKVTMNFRLFTNTDPETTALYQAARQRSPVPMMLQLGQQGGQLCGVYVKGLVPTVPEFDDGDKRLQWRFSGSQAQGVSNDELIVAFG